jgi:hypothetical protein
MPEGPKPPVEFSDLQYLADSFAVSDDVKRGERMDATSIIERRRLVDTVWPRLNAINGYLDNHDDDAAHLLGRLAEAACEVAIEIGRPAHS